MRSSCIRLLYRPTQQLWRQPRRHSFGTACRGASTSSHFISPVFDGETHDFAYTNLPQDERRLLGRARLHNIYSQEQLLFEADIGTTKNVGTKLTDKRQHRQNLELWKLILDVNRYYHGIDGVKATWKGMRYRGAQVQLPPENPTALELWQTIITAAATEDLDFLHEIVWNCNSKDVLQSRLFVDIVGTLLRHTPRYAPKLAQRLRKTRSVGREELLALFDVACEAKDRFSLQAFRDVRSSFPDKRLYHDLIPRLHELGRMDDALQMHNSLLSQQDLPKTFDVIAPFIRHLASADTTMDPFLHGLRAAGISFEAQARRLYARERARLVGFHPEAMNIVVSRTFGREPRTLKDETISRALATPGFSFDFVIKFLQPFGLIEFGPLSVRQMVLHSADPREVKSRFDQLRDYNIDLGSSTYVRTIKKLSSTGQTHLLDAVARTDMHHEEFENRSLQKSLVGQYLEKRNFRQMNLSLTILHRGETTSSIQASAARSILRSAIDLGDWTAVLQAVQLCRLHRYRVTNSIIRRLVAKVVSLSKAEQEGMSANMDPLGFLAGVLQQLLVMGSEVQPWDWIELVRGLGRLGRLDELERLMMWLAEYYHLTKLDGKHRNNIVPDLGKLFTPNILRAMISWSFTKQDWRLVSSSSENGLLQLRPKPWLRGATIARTLRDKFGISVDVPYLQECFLLRVRALYHVKSWSRLQDNRSYALSVGAKPMDYLTEWSEFWGLKVSDQQRIALFRSLRGTPEHRRRKRLQASR